MSCNNNYYKNETFADVSDVSKQTPTIIKPTKTNKHKKTIKIILIVILVLLILSLIAFFGHRYYINLPKIESVPLIKSSQPTLLSPLKLDQVKLLSAK